MRLFEPGTGKCLGTRIVDTGGGYCSQNVMPVHFGLPRDGKVDVEVTSFTASGRKTTRVAGACAASLRTASSMSMFRRCKTPKKLDSKDNLRHARALPQAERESIS